MPGTLKVLPRRFRAGAGYSGCVSGPGIAAVRIRCFSNNRLASDRYRGRRAFHPRKRLPRPEVGRVAYLVRRKRIPRICVHRRIPRDGRAWYLVQDCVAGRSQRNARSGEPLSWLRSDRRWRLFLPGSAQPPRKPACQNLLPKPLPFNLGKLALFSRWTVLVLCSGSCFELHCSIWHPFYWATL